MMAVWPVDCELSRDAVADEFTQRQPLALNGHESPVRAIVFDRKDRLASGGSDGAAVL